MNHHPGLSDVCGPGQPLLARSAADGLMINQGGGWRPFGFNDLYQGEYPACNFTALAYAGSEFYLAGLNPAGQPHLFTSLLGTVWEMRSLTTTHPLLGTQRAAGAIVKILFEDEQNQVFLVCSSGQLVTLSDCPKCIRIQQVSDQELLGGRIDGGQLILNLADGREAAITLSDAVQYRVALSFMQGHLKNGSGLIVDLRSNVEFASGNLPGSINITMDDLPEWLGEQSIDQAFFFICRVGLLADDAARLARNRGFRKAWSLGGIRFLA